MSAVDQIDYLAIGHICHDVVPGGTIMGGSAAYAGSIAQALGCRVAVLTSGAAEDDWQAALPEILVAQKLSDETTCFDNVYVGGARQQTIHAVAGTITSADVPEAWRRAAIAHIAPIANEVEPGMVELFSNSLVGLSPQGWMRRWDEEGRVYAVEWEDAVRLLPLAAATFLSEEDLPQRGDLERYVALSPLLVQTAGADGCTVFFHGESRHFPAPETTLVDPTGAGDSFAAAYLVRLLQTSGDPWESARFANAVAAQTVSHQGIAAKVEAVRRQLELAAKPDQM